MTHNLPPLPRCYCVICIEQPLIVYRGPSLHRAATALVAGTCYVGGPDAVTATQRAEVERWRFLNEGAKG